MAYNTSNLEELKEFTLWYAGSTEPAPSLYYHFSMWQYLPRHCPGIAGSAGLFLILSFTNIKTRREPSGRGLRPP